MTREGSPESPSFDSANDCIAVRLPVSCGEVAKPPIRGCTGNGTSLHVVLQHGRHESFCEGKGAVRLRLALLTGLDVDRARR